MPHIHIEPGQHDLTTSAYIVRLDGDEPRCLVHMHRKLGKLLQVGGHVELNETPWAALAHELREESGYTFEELAVLQPQGAMQAVNLSTMHPVPTFFNTHHFDATHFHTDLGYGFVAQAAPKAEPLEGESQDVRWLTLKEFAVLVKDGQAYEDTYLFYKQLIEHFLPNYQQLQATEFSVADPS